MFSKPLESIPLMYKYALLAFTVIAISAVFSYPTAETGAHFLAVTLTAIVADLALSFAKQKRIIVPYSAYISGLILSMLMPFETPLLTKIFVPIVAIASKKLLKWKGKHVFNPASFGLVVSSLFLLVPVTWWGTIVWPLVAVVGLALMYKIEKWRTGASFYLGFAVLQIAYNSYTGVGIESTVTNFLLSGSLFFFGFFMVIEPKTSPFTKKGQIAFGILTAILAFASQFLIPQWFPLIGLLVMNIFAQAINKHTLK